MKLTVGRTSSSTFSIPRQVPACPQYSPSSSPPVYVFERVVVNRGPLPPACSGPRSQAWAASSGLAPRPREPTGPPSYPPKQIRDRGSPWFALLSLQLEKDPSCPRQVIWLWGRFPLK